MRDLRFYIAYAMIAFGAFKLSVAAYILYFSRQKDNNHDDSVAGRMMYVILLYLGIFTLLHGLSIIRVAPSYVAEIFHEHWLHVIWNLKLGIFSLVFFSFVVYTDLVQKSPDMDDTYKIFGIGGGLAFLAAVPLVIIVDSMLHHNHHIAVVFIAFVAFLTLSYSIYREIQSYVASRHGSIVDVISMEVLNSIGNF